LPKNHGSPICQNKIKFCWFREIGLKRISFTLRQIRGTKVNKQVKNN
jgi:hypothetical protein